MLTKEKLLESIKAMPEEKFEDIDILLERIVLLEKIENGEQDIVDGRIFSNEEAIQNLSKWLL